MSTDPFAQLEAWLEFAQQNRPGHDNMADLSYGGAPIGDADLAEALRKHKALRASMRKHADVSATAIATDLMALLNRAKSLGIAVYPDTEIEDEQTEYTIEWVTGDVHSRLDIGYDAKAQRWALMRRSSYGR